MVDRNPGLVTGLAVAPEIGMLYWSDDDGDGMETLYQGRMDGTSIEQIKTFGKVKVKHDMAKNCYNNMIYLARVKTVRVIRD